MVYAVIQLENNLLKALLAFEKGIGGEKKEICIDSLLVETGDLKTELHAVEKQEKYLQGKKIEPLMSQSPSPKRNMCDESL